MSPFTLDGDLAADPRKIRRARAIPDHLEPAGFVFRNEYGGFYSLDDVTEDDRYASKIDVLVPQAVEHLWEAEDYSTRDSRATHSQQGLELCLLDHSPMALRPIDFDDVSEPVVVEVASILALLVAKGWKIGERFEQGPDAFEEVRKDIADGISPPAGRGAGRNGGRTSEAPIPMERARCRAHGRELHRQPLSSPRPGFIASTRHAWTRGGSGSHHCIARGTCRRVCRAR